MLPISIPTRISHPGPFDDRLLLPCSSFLIAYGEPLAFRARNPDRATYPESPNLVLVDCAPNTRRAHSEKFGKLLNGIELRHIFRLCHLGHPAQFLPIGGKSITFSLDVNFQ